MLFSLANTQRAQEEEEGKGEEKKRDKIGKQSFPFIVNKEKLSSCFCHGVIYI